MNDLMISCNDVSYKYKTEEDKVSKFAVNSMNLDIVKGEFLVILGHNGSGKSTFAKLLNVLLTPSEGNVLVEGLNTKDEDKTWDIRKRVGMVFQNPDNQIVATIVEEDVAFGPENLGIESSEIRKRVDSSLKIVNMEEYKKHAPHLLSGGQKQRVAIAGILAMRPECIVLDESTAMLDPLGRKEVMETIRNLNSEYNMTIIHITHFMEEAINADRIIVMNEGEVILKGKPKEVFKNVELLKSVGLDVPEMTELAYELNKNGFKFNEDILTIDEMVDALCQLK